MTRCYKPMPKTAFH